MHDNDVRYMLLRDGRHWEPVSMERLELTAEGVLTLARVPGAVGSERLEERGPYGVGASGLAVDEDGFVYVADAVHRRIVQVDRRCDARWSTQGCGDRGSSFDLLQQPQAMLVVPDERLYVLDGFYKRVHVFHLPSLEPHDVWRLPLANPVAFACDSESRLYVLDQVSREILRFDAAGAIDPGFRLDSSSVPGMILPQALAIDLKDRLLISDPGAHQIHCFDPRTSLVSSISNPESVTFEPGAVVCWQNRLYCADRSGGAIWAYDLAAGLWLGPLPDYRGPVSALAVDTAGTLFIKPTQDDRYFVLDKDECFVGAGTLTTELLDAGVRNQWERVSLALEQPSGTRIAVEYFVSNSTDVLPNPDWIAAPGVDFLIAKQGVAPARYLQLRIRLSTLDRRTSPALTQVEVATAGEDSRNYLPAVFARLDTDHSLKRFLDLLRSEWRDWEHELEEMYRRFDPRTTSEESLAWLASWLAFQLPRFRPRAEWRDIIDRVPEIYARRGTVEGLKDWIELYTGISVHLVEAFRFRKIWQLDTHSLLGFDTVLPDADADGMVVPDAAEAMVVGQAVVGATAPNAKANWGETLFGPTAFRFSVYVCAWHARCQEQRDAIRALLEAEKPAHTDFELCFIEPTLRIGLQAAIGIDTYVADRPAPLLLDETRLDVNTHLDPRIHARRSTLPHGFDTGPQMRVGVDAIS